MNIYRVLDTNELYRQTFWKSPYPPLPEEVQEWNDRLQELFCIFSMRHQSDGMTMEAADARALEQVKESEDFVRWGPASQKTSADKEEPC